MHLSSGKKTLLVIFHWHPCYGVRFWPLSFCFMALWNTPLKFNITPTKLPWQKEWMLSSNHHFWGAMSNFGFISPPPRKNAKCPWRSPAKTPAMARGATPRAGPVWRQGVFSGGVLPCNYWICLMVGVQEVGEIEMLMEIVWLSDEVRRNPWPTLGRWWKSWNLRFQMISKFFMKNCCFGAPEFPRQLPFQTHLAQCICVGTLKEYLVAIIRC